METIVVDLEDLSIQDPDIELPDLQILSIDSSVRSICSCGRYYRFEHRFWIYDKNFCSMECLHLYKKSIELDSPKEPTYFNKPDYGGAC